MPSSKGEATQPLRGRTILITRSEQQSKSFASRLTELGACVIECPTIIIRPPDDSTPLDAALRNLDAIQWLILTSANGVHAVMKRLQQIQGSSPLPHHIKICTVGPKTAEALEPYGIKTTLMPQTYTGEGVVDCITPHLNKGDTVLFPKAAAARDIIPSSLRRLGVTVLDPVAYQSVPPDQLPEAAKTHLQSGTLDCAIFTAPSTVKNLCNLLGSKDALQQALLHTQIFSIGPITTAACSELGLTPVHEPPDATTESLISLLINRMAEHPA
mgnify:FL=1